MIVLLTLGVHGFRANWCNNDGIFGNPIDLGSDVSPLQYFRRFYEDGIPVLFFDSLFSGMFYKMSVYPPYPMEVVSIAKDSRDPITDAINELHRMIGSKPADPDAPF